MKTTSTVLSLVAALICAAGAEPVPGGASGKLPKIFVDAANKGFVDSNGQRFIPCGVSYYRPGTGWAPQLWKQFDAEATRRDFQRMKSMGLNVARVFITYGSFWNEQGQLDPAGLAAFDRMLEIADEVGIYLHPTGPAGWEGEPAWKHAMGDGWHSNEAYLQARDEFWRMFAGRYRGRTTIFAYDLQNEPSVEWDSVDSRAKWDAWRVAHQQPIVPAPAKDAEPSDIVADYQRFRETLAEAWVARQCKVIKEIDPGALTTVGLIQWSVPGQPVALNQYSAFRPELIAPHLDFMSLHFYPLATGVYHYNDRETEDRNLAVLESMVRECAKPGKPVVIGEFGWYGGGSLDPGGRVASEEEQARWCTRLVEVTASMASGWINWGLYDAPEATDVSRLTGLLTVEGKEKVWGKTFAPLVRSTPLPAEIPVRPDLPWDTVPGDKAAAKRFQADYLEAFLEAKH